MQVPIGEMRESVAILTPTLQRDESGGEETVYVEGNPIFVAIRGTTAREIESFGQVNGDISHICFGHWADLGAVSSKSRIRILESGQEFDIAGPPVNSPTRDWTKLTLVWRENG